MEDQPSGEYLDRLVDEQSLRAYLESELGAANTFSVEYHSAGHSNETLFVEWGERDLVIRRPPPGKTADKAHDVLREYRIIDAVKETDVPVPTPLLACEDHSVIGSDFYVMDYLDGDVLRSSEPDRFATTEHREQIGIQFVETAVGIHSLDYEEIGLGELGYPDGFTERQVKRWWKQLEWAFERTNEVRAVPTLHDVADWLQDNVPDEYEHTLVHGDYKLDNVMFAPGTPPELVGVFDWELSTLGDPLTDLGWALSFWRDPDDPAPALPELQPQFLEHPAYPTRRELIETYEAGTGATFAHERFYVTLGVFKMAALGEMFFRRYLEGNSDDSLYPVMEKRVPALAERAKKIIDGEITI